MSSIFNVFGRYTTPYLIRRYIFGNDTSCTYDAPLADGHSVAYYCVAADKCIFLNMNFPCSKSSSFFLRVYVMGQYGRTLSYSCIFPYCD